jgi:hypothetical protein
MNRSPAFNQSPWGLAHSLGLAGVGDNNGRNVTMSAMRVHRLRALAVQKLAAAYKADEIASSVMVMQGGSVFDDIAERVLKFGACICDMVSGDCIRNLYQIPRTLMLDMSISSMRGSPQGISHALHKATILH